MILPFRSSIGVAYFGSEGIVAYTAEGKLLWKKDLGLQNAGWFFDPDSEWGAASSPVIYKNAVILQCDRQKDSFMTSLDLKDGKELWLTARAEAQDPKMALALMRDLTALDQKKALKEAKVPVRCINSAGGFQFFTPTAADVNKKYADYAAVTIADVGHYPMLEKPDEFNQKLRVVLREFATRK